MRKRGKFIVFEGIDGSGKSTLVRHLKEQMTAEGIPFYDTCEPTNSPIGSIIRNVLNRRIQMDEKTIAALFLADRLDHIQNEANGMLKFLDQGIHVISDRYYFSSYAYHSTHMPMDWVINCNVLCAELLRPDLNLFINISVETSLGRLQKNRTFHDIFETKERITSVRNNYLEAIERLKDQEQISIIDGERSPDAVFADVWTEVSNVLGIKSKV